MNKSGTICDLLNWLEENLDRPLSLDEVAARVGYSKWHLQRKFKETTGQVLGAYIRARRLSNAAMALRLTSKPLAAIALQYHFESQQSFNRAFKKQFLQTPALYRRSMKWDFYGLEPPLRGRTGAVPQSDIITLPELQLEGITQSYTCTLEQLSLCRTQLRQRFWGQFLDEAQSDAPVLYGLSYSRPASVKNGENEVWYTTAAEPQYLPVKLENMEMFKLNAGDYAQFTYAGPTEGLQRFIMDLYGICLPLLQVVRREGYDIERFQRLPQPDADAGQETDADIVHCDYLIPIMR